MSKVDTALAVRVQEDIECRRDIGSQHSSVSVEDIAFVVIAQEYADCRHGISK